VRKKQFVLGLSVVVTNHNKGNLIFQALDSVTPQLTDADDVVMFDDFSGDEQTFDAFSRFSGQLEGITFTKSAELLGAAEAKNRAIALARSECIVLLDADDLLPPGSLDKIRSTFLDYPNADIVFGNYSLVGVGSSEHRIVDLSSLTDQEGWLDPIGLAKGGWELLGTSPFRKAVWETVGGFDKRYPVTDDVDFFRRAFSFGFQARYVPETIYQWNRGQGGNSSAATPRLVARSWLRNLKFYRGFLSPKLFTVRFLQQLLIVASGKKINLDLAYSQVMRVLGFIRTRTQI